MVENNEEIHFFMCSKWLCFGCTSNNDDQSVSKPNPLIYSETRENIYFTIWVNQKEFTLEDEIIVKASATNVGEKSAIYAAGSSTCVTHLRIQIVSKETNRSLSVKPLEIMACTDDLHVE
jgi:hypothetical protein